MRSTSSSLRWVAKVAGATAMLAFVGALARPAEAAAADAAGPLLGLVADPSVYGLFAFAAVCLLTGLPVRAVFRRHRIKAARARRSAARGPITQGDA